MSDLIDRQAAIDALEKVAALFPWKVPGNRDSYDRYNEAWNDAIGRAEIEIEELPSVQPEQRWIPCGERLPEVGTYVLISKKALGFRSNLPNVCTAHRSHDPRSGKEEWNDMLFGKLDDDDVLAWMPLPEPYRAERRTDD